MPPKARGAARGGPGRGGSKSNRGGNSNPATNPAPRGRGRGGSNPQIEPCRFLLRGSCKYVTGCRYSHDITRIQGNDSPRPFFERQNPIAIPRPVANHSPPVFNHPPPAADSPPPVANFPGLSNDQFSKVEMSLTPGQAFNSFKIYLEDDFRFRTPEQVYRFLNILCAANSQNTSWTAKDGQLHLHQLVQGNGIIRLAEAIRFPSETDRPWSFQRGYIPIFTYMSSDWVVKSTLNSDINALYGLFHRNFQTIRIIVETNMRKFMAARSFNDGYQSFSGKKIFKVLFVTLFEYLIRFKEALATNPGVRDFANQIVEWFDQWLAALGSNPPFKDECTTYDEAQREFIIENIRRDKERVLRKIRHGQTIVLNNGNDNTRRSYQPRTRADLGLVATLERKFDFDGPGEFCETGPRHDNDHAEIELIRVAPTRDELLCPDDPYLPANFFEAPHFHEPGSPERLLDIQFRLLREELTSPIRLAVHLIVEDFKKLKSGTTALSKILNSRGGRYVAPATAQESIMFSVFTGIAFQPLELNNRGISAGIWFDTPPGRARNEQPGLRAEYWEQVSKKRLMQDGLVALIWKDHIGNVDVYVGTVSSSGRDLVECAKADGGDDQVMIRVSFFDAKANIRILQALQSRQDNNDLRVLIEAPVFYEGIRPFLEALKREPELLPFAQYLRLQSQEELSRTVISPPLYSRTPGFSFELKDLFPPGAGVETLRLTTHDPDSVANARAQLHRSRLDPSQAEAVVDSLTREIALIQGPPGTGKSYTGLELIRVLIKNNVLPILLVAFTNHALDHMLTGILDAKITDKIVRLGSRFAMDERLAQYSLDTIEREEAKSRLGASGRSAYRTMKELESEMEGLMNDITSHKVPSVHIEQYISIAYPHHYGELFTHPPPWIRAIAPKPSDPQEGWERAGEPSKQLESILDFWLRSGDFKHLETTASKGSKAKTSAPVSSSNTFGVFSSSGTGNGGTAVTRQKNDLQHFMREHGLRSVPTIPKTTRPVEDLLKNPQVWRMSRSERAALHGAWSVEASHLTNDSQIQIFEEFRQLHTDASETHREVTEQIKAEILSRSHIVGCTTTGAAKLISLLSGMSPKVMIVEEAGQVLEAHILASLVESVEHVMLIGDPLQLRPNINSYKLSMDNPKTGKIYRFDQSLMERLSSSGFPMSQIDVQRRMRPEISSLIRNTLYPKLQDNDRVLSYPDVRGMYKNMFFVSHDHKEVGGGEDSVSKHNSFEINMIYDLVMHLLKQGLYNTPGNIVVLAAYLGQIPKLRQKLQKMVKIVIDERDAELLDQHEMDQEEETATVQEVQVSKQVIIRTLDNFQGEEGEVVILSLVRNGGTPFDEETSSLEHSKGRTPIGFLKSLNRTNVGLSRAKHGLYIFGNAPELAQGSRMWSDVLKELHSTECLGPKLPIACYRHPDYIKWIGNPGEIPIVSPNGGCDQPCGEALSCGHICPALCHADDPNHISTKCLRPCIRLCVLLHPCDRKCWECSKELAKCRFPIINLELPCGHIHPPTQCHVINIPENIRCPTQVLKRLPCGHQKTMPCHQDHISYNCLEQVVKQLPCDHQKTMLCHQDPTSYKCLEQVVKQLPCNHEKTMPCHRNPTSYKCQQQVVKQLACGHEATMPCHQDPASYKCLQQVVKELPNCQHRPILPCPQDPVLYLCKENVEKQLPGCGHSMRMKCHQNPANTSCPQPVEKKLSCGHLVTAPCHQDMSKYTCKVEVEKRLPKCGHTAKLPCHQNPTKALCRERVTRVLPCNHSVQLSCREDFKAYKCQEQVQKTFSNCDHSKQLKCHQLKDATAQTCQEQVEKDIPTCEHRAIMPCHMDPSKYKCREQAEKELPFCEHRATMPCNQDSKSYSCPKQCGRVLSCCSATCSGICGACHKLNKGETRTDGRTKHAKHICKRPMACGHACNTPCGEGHVCAVICKADCQQNCGHSKCRQKCSTPCKSCEKPCAWKCTHVKCISPCGMACTRLPCDRKCPNVLGCGHSCPSVCGEPCEQQTCTTCSEDTQGSISDLLKRVHLRNLESGATLDSMTITLPCRHVFTVESLDSITRIHDFYERDSRGEWTKAVTPNASGVRDRPVCPHCGGRIDSLRYGRILKSSNHSIVQHNLAHSLSDRLSNAEKMLMKARRGLENAATEAIRSLGSTNFPAPSEATRRTLLERINSALSANQAGPTNLEIVENLSKFHGFPPRHTRAWRKAINEISATYQAAYSVTFEADPSVQAYDTSLGRLYLDELNKIGGSSARTTDPAQLRLQDLASKVAHVRIGHPRPRACVRFTVEAFWITIEILVILGLAAGKACKELQEQNAAGVNVTHWENVAEFILLRASQDAETALRLANESKSPNKAIICRRLILQTQYEHAAHKCRVAIRNGALLNRETRDEYLAMCARSIEQIRELQTSIPREYQEKVRRGAVLGVAEMKAEWVRENFVQPAQEILEAWNNLIRAIQIDMAGWDREQAYGDPMILWRPVVQEHAASNRKSHTQRFYQCPRGHPYTRQECAVALGSIWCPECGMVVGTSD